LLVADRKSLSTSSSRFFRRVVFRGESLQPVGLALEEAALALLRSQHAAELVALEYEFRVVYPRHGLACGDGRADLCDPGEAPADFGGDPRVVAADHRARHLDARRELGHLRRDDTHGGGRRTALCSGKRGGQRQQAQQARQDCFIHATSDSGQCWNAQAGRSGPA
jgi:hypothetical protein